MCSSYIQVLRGIYTTLGYTVLLLVRILASYWSRIFPITLSSCYGVMLWHHWWDRGVEVRNSALCKVKICFKKSQDLRIIDRKTFKVSPEFLVGECRLNILYYLLNLTNYYLTDHHAYRASFIIPIIARCCHALNILINKYSSNYFVSYWITCNTNYCYKGRCQ